MSLDAEIVCYPTGRDGDEAYRAYVKVGSKDEDDYAILAGCFGPTEHHAREIVVWKLKQVIKAASQLTKVQTRS